MRKIVRVALHVDPHSMQIGSGDSLWNINSLVAQRNARLNGLKLAQTMNRLASGSRINTAADDPAGLIASQSMYATLAALDAETSANERASDQADTAGAALGQVSDLLTQAKSLISANANTGGISADEKAANQMQIDSILSTVDRLSSSTTFNGQNLLDGSATISATGASLAIASSSTSNIGKVTDNGTDYTLASIKNGANAGVAGDVIDQAIKDVATQQGKIGAFEKDTLAPQIANIASSREQLTSTVSMIHDTDYASEASNESRLQLLQQASLLALNNINHRTQISTFSVLA